MRRSGSGIRGRLFGRNVLEGTFRAAPDEDLFIGELLVGVDEATGRRYLFRVVDVTYGSEHREPGWAERVAGTLLADDERGETGAHPLHEQDAAHLPGGRLPLPRVSGSARAGRVGPIGVPQAQEPAQPVLGGGGARRPRISPSWPSAWATSRSGSCAAGRPSSTSRSAFPAPAWRPTWASSPPPGWASPT